MLLRNSGNQNDHYIWHDRRQLQRFCWLGIYFTAGIISHVIVRDENLEKIFITPLNYCFENMIDLERSMQYIVDGGRNIIIISNIYILVRTHDVIVLRHDRFVSKVHNITTVYSTIILLFILYSVIHINIDTNVVSRAFYAMYLYRGGLPQEYMNVASIDVLSEACMVGCIRHEF